jgi:predicted kinase
MLSAAESAGLQAWLEAGARKLAPEWDLRRLSGHVRECHGDLHLDNIVDLDGAVAGIDAIEFDPALRWNLFALARTLLGAGFSVVIDAAFLRRGERDAAHELARQCGARFEILACQAPDGVLRERLAARTSDASEADAAVLQQLRAAADPLGPHEPLLHGHGSP